MMQVSGELKGENDTLFSKLNDFQNASLQIILKYYQVDIVKRLSKFNIEYATSKPLELDEINKIFVLPILKINIKFWKENIHSLHQGIQWYQEILKSLIILTKQYYLRKMRENYGATRGLNILQMEDTDEAAARKVHHEVKILSEKIVSIDMDQFESMITVLPLDLALNFLQLEDKFKINWLSDAIHELTLWEHSFKNALKEKVEQAKLFLESVESLSNHSLDNGQPFLNRAFDKMNILLNYAILSAHRSQYNKANDIHDFEHCESALKQDEILAVKIFSNRPITAISDLKNYLSVFEPYFDFFIRYQNKPQELIKKLEEGCGRELKILQEWKKQHCESIEIRKNELAKKKSYPWYLTKKLLNFIYSLTPVSTFAKLVPWYFKPFTFNTRWQQSTFIPKTLALLGGATTIVYYYSSSINNLRQECSMSLDSIIPVLYSLTKMFLPMTLAIKIAEKRAEQQIDFQYAKVSTRKKVNTTRVFYQISLTLAFAEAYFLPNEAMQIIVPAIIGIASSEMNQWLFMRFAVKPVPLLRDSFNAREEMQYNRIILNQIGYQLGQIISQNILRAMAKRNELANVLLNQESIIFPEIEPIHSIASPPVLFGYNRVKVAWQQANDFTLRESICDLSEVGTITLNALNKVCKGHNFL